MIKINSKEDVLLIDFSYFFIYRYYALNSWFKISETPYDDELFLTKYKKLFLTNIENTIKKLKMKHHNTILVGDCPRSNIWRKALFNDYKGNRDKLYERSPINPKIFPIIYDEIIPMLQKKGIQFICVDELEADDVVYGITRKIDNKIVILTNDNDYLQLIKDNIDIVNLPSYKSIKHRGLSCPTKDLLLKVLCGDPSDNIPSVIGKKLATKFVNNESGDELEKYISGNSLLERVNLNTSLIDMRNIPKELLDKIEITMFDGHEKTHEIPKTTRSRKKEVVVNTIETHKINSYFKEI
jgi:5'-3' exonuclease